ncbi:hypothetical protein O181_105276 [Austropuccinia psidii MF-1]|uniref:Uncharacterized protein n=1 Tax=Austropuccinia psidii MF-1 TaxID=1389203 RepID=A0A9Q3JNS6_9BASI|nr:hypothetical protein [Austropuccinia psidii MF-1]
MANWPYPSPVANMATSSSYGPFVFWGLCGPSPQSRSHSGNLCPNGYFWSFPSKPGEMAQMDFFAIWAHNAHLHILHTLRICAYLRTFAHFDAKCAKDTFPPFGLRIQMWPKPPKDPETPLQALKPSHPSFPLCLSIVRPLDVIFFPMNQYAINDVIYHCASFFNSNSMVAISNGHFNIPTYHHVIKAPNHSEDSSRLKSKCFSVKDQSHHQDVIG